MAKYTDAQVKRIGATTVKKRVGAVQALLGYASQEGWIESNVGLGLTVEGAGRPKRRRRNFTTEEIAVLFGSDLFLRPSGLVQGKTKVSDLTLFWIFLLGITSGARIEEIGQAHRKDVRRRDGVLHIDIDDYVPDDAAREDLHEKSLKTDESRRVIPIHDRLIEIGFERYVQALEKNGQDLLFVDLDPNRFGKLTQEASRRANRYIDAIVSDDRRLVFHSLRHTFKDAGREADVQERILDQLCGHAPTSIGGKYGSGVGRATLKRNLDRMLFQAVDWTAIISATKGFDWDAAVKKVARPGRE